MVNTGLTTGVETVHAVPMASERDRSRPWHPLSVPVPPGLSGAETAAVETGLGALPGAWCMVRHVDEVGEISMVVTARDVADDVAPTYVVHREGALLRLDVCRGDAYARLGAYGGVAPLMRALAAALAGARVEG